MMGGRGTQQRGIFVHDLDESQRQNLNTVAPRERASTMSWRICSKTVDTLALNGDTLSSDSEPKYSK